MVSDDLPDAGPLQPDAVHVVVRDLHDLLQAEHPRLVGRGQLVHGDGAQPAHKVHCKSQTATGEEEELVLMMKKNFSFFGHKQISEM